jgi:hypothetical protein
VKNDRIIKKLGTQEYNSYKLKPGEEYDYTEFGNAELFKKTSKPIRKMMAKLKAIMNNAKRDSKIIFVTARGDFDSRDIFLDTFKQYGIDMSKVYVERSGNLKLSTAAGKKQIFIKYLNTGLYSRVRLYDDHKENLNALLDLKNDYPDVDFMTYLVKKGGTTKAYNK